MENRLVPAARDIAAGYHTGNPVEFIRMSAAEDYIQQARGMAAGNSIINAIHLYGKAMREAPDIVAYKNEFIRYLQPKNLRIISGTLKTLMTECLADPATDWSRAGSAWQSLMLADPAFKPFPKLVKIKKYSAFAKKISSIEKTALFENPYFLYGIARTTVPNIAFERFLTFLRRYLLERRETTSLPPALAYVLARYCHRTEYVFFATDEEKKILDSLQQTERDQVLLACYRTIADANLVKQPSPSWIDLAKEQAAAGERIEQERRSIAPLTPIDDAISLLVQSQYEKYPYPAWDAAAPHVVSEQERAAAGKPGAQILNAGCGTGKEAIELALTYPDAQVLAVDLSTASLAYGQAKAREYGLKNIAFRQADILQIGKAGMTFDFIASSGVLHHMASPYDGWAALKSVLNPDGLMRVALYSKPARREINEARKAIARKGYDAGDDSIRNFRQNIQKLLKRRSWKNIAEFYDYYFLNECCDLLFHVQELQFTPLMIAEHLQKLGLSFEGFYLPAKTKMLYAKRFAHDPGQRDLNNWDKFEQKYPDTFRNMYVFWCKNA
ncbi:MAG: hypothetical protein DI551_06395 [Micavibrio aeruginosavorus]|uniref:Methyltransferase domain-containing protein n=1 Tax=Micavibrio aeruginosavorus TaxID=349221 RepID=A0A2W5MX66_9BACT|nr:MAG: hypothetical protein DI551_06395 [Micavibrio aeruginosavorus]